MRTQKFLLTVVLSFASASQLFSQESTTRDLRSITVLGQSFRAMGGAVPTDSVVIGTATIVTGPTTEEAAIRLLTRGTDQSSEEAASGGVTRRLVFSHGRASETDSTRPLPLERVLSSQSPYFPLILIASALGDPESGFEYVGLESLDGAAAHHVRLWKTFSSRPTLRPLAEVSKKDIWIDAASALPLRVSFEQRNSRGPGSFGVPVEISYSDFRNVQGVLYPFKLDRTFNGVHQATIAITNVSFNTGLGDSDFAIR